MPSKAGLLAPHGSPEETGPQADAARYARDRHDRHEEPPSTDQVADTTTVLMISRPAMVRPAGWSAKRARPNRARNNQTASRVWCGFHSAQAFWAARSGTLWRLDSPRTRPRMAPFCHPPLGRWPQLILIKPNIAIKPCFNQTIPFALTPYRLIAVTRGQLGTCDPRGMNVTRTANCGGTMGRRRTKYRPGRQTARRGGAVGGPVRAAIPREKYSMGASKGGQRAKELRVRIATPRTKPSRTGRPGSNTPRRERGGRP